MCKLAAGVAALMHVQLLFRHDQTEHHIHVELV